MRLCLVALLTLAGCSSGSDHEVRGLWMSQAGLTSLCRVFCDDGLTLETFGDDPTCSEWRRFSGRLACFPYDVDGDQLEIDGPPGWRIAVSENSQQLTWNYDDGDPYIYNRLADSHPVCDQPCYRAGNEDEPLR
jgi:hypothetical protein